MDISYNDDYTSDDFQGNSAGLNGDHPQIATGSDRSESGDTADSLAWSNHSGPLTEWTIVRFVNRDDVFGRYVDLCFRGSRQHSYTAPSAERRFPGALTLGLLRQHYQGQSRGHLIGVHSTSTNDTSKWLAIDIDHHGEQDQPATQANFNAALVWQQQLVDIGFTPLLMDSNGNGGLHLVTFFQRPAPTPLVHHLGQWLIQSFRDLGLSAPPETFPKQPRLSPTCRYGNWLRLPGLHHTRDHWTRLYQAGKWLSDADAIRVVISTPGDEVQLLHDWAAAHPIPPSADIVTVRRTRARRTSCQQHLGVAEAGFPHAQELSKATRDFLNGQYKDGPRWNDRLFRAACDLAGVGFSEVTATPMLLGGAAPYDAQEEAVALKTIRSAFSSPRVAARHLTTVEAKDECWLVKGIEVNIRRQPHGRAPGKE